MTMYRWINALQEPFDSQQVDDQGRAVVIFNVIAEKAKSATFLREIVKVLQDAGVGTFGTNLHAGSSATLPPAGGFVVVISTGGPSPLKTHNVDGVSYQRPTAMIRSHAKKYEDADAKARAAYDALTVVKNEDVTAA